MIALVVMFVLSLADRLVGRRARAPPGRCDHPGDAGDHRDRPVTPHRRVRTSRRTAHPRRHNRRDARPARPRFPGRTDARRGRLPRTAQPGRGRAVERRGGARRRRRHPGGTAGVSRRRAAVHPADEPPARGPARDRRTRSEAFTDRDVDVARLAASAAAEYGILASAATHDPRADPRRPGGVRRSRRSVARTGQPALERRPARTRRLHRDDRRRERPRAGRGSRCATRAPASPTMPGLGCSTASTGSPRTPPPAADSGCRSRARSWRATRAASASRVAAPTGRPSSSGCRSAPCRAPRRGRTSRRTATRSPERRPVTARRSVAPPSRAS